ncbi:MAG: tRNA (pseudouridine(54)-N(1))-methyltransferase TrmY [Archaeoglobaceae archaeon]|nr:tRNA (pseudouridine(54)-N(1))-methyltransferase TrmY [Archaeoglobaceae archaeon]MDW7989381.1 tRNA (pseudouridine(54)-N(1))-methyltransferase TrmY [Archaeoglobaceae archaeon]
MRGFLIIGNEAVTEPFNLSDLPGAGRMDVLCRCVSQALFLSHSMRRDVEVYLLLLGKPNPPKVIKISSNELRRMSPDERNIGGHIRKAVGFKISKDWVETNSGIFVAKKNIEELLDELSSSYTICYLREDGESIRNEIYSIKNPLFIVGDHIGVKKQEEDIILYYAVKILSVSKLSLMAEQCITIAHYELDKHYHENFISI